jgi:hypothetical protein
MNKIIPPMFDSVIDSLWIEIPKYLEWLFKQRKNKNPIYGINLSIILHSCTLIEGFIYDVLEEEIGTPQVKKFKKLEERLYNELCLKLQIATWTNYISLFELITNQKLSQLTDNETWKGISVLFQLRNMMTHGKSIEIVIHRESENSVTLNNKYPSIISYLKEVGIKSPTLPVPTTPLISNESADHFYGLTKKFIQDLHQNYLIPKNGEIWDSFAIAFEE